MKTRCETFFRGAALGALLWFHLASVLPTASSAEAAGQGLTTVYVNRYFEVRQDQAPTKYIFNGETRVARATGSLSANIRVQRLRIYPGWNLCSLAVTATNVLSQLSASVSQPAIEALYRWIPSTGGYAAVAAGEGLPADTVVWLKSITNATLSVVGLYVEPTNFTSATLGAYVASAGLEAWGITKLLPRTVSVWKHDPLDNLWKVWLRDPLETSSDLLTFLAPGEAIFIQADAPVQLEMPETTLRIRYYHQDHIGSSSVVGDAAGALVEETVLYPFGHPRSAFQPRGVHEDYGFTQKEQDQESGLDYFEARYLNSLQGRFLSPDPLRESDNSQNPQSWNCYAYAFNNPIRYVDPRGLYVWDQSLGGAAADKDVKEKEILEQRAAIRAALQKGAEKAKTLAEGSDKNLVLRGFNIYGAEGDTGVIVGRRNESGGHTTYHDGKVTITLSSDAKGWALAGTLAHEGTHAADDFDFWNAAKKDRDAAKTGPLNRTDYEQEFRGYKVESILAQATHPKSHLRKGENIIWDSSWKADEIEKNRTAAINQLLANHPNYGYTPQKPGERILPIKK